MTPCKIEPQMMRHIENDIAQTGGDPTGYQQLFYSLVAHIKWLEEAIKTQGDDYTALKHTLQGSPDVLEIPDPDKKVHPSTPQEVVKSTTPLDTNKAPETVVPPSQPDKGPTPRQKGAASGPLKGSKG